MFLSFPISPRISTLLQEIQRPSVHEIIMFWSIRIHVRLEHWCTRQIRAKAYVEFWEGWE